MFDLRADFFHYYTFILFFFSHTPLIPFFFLKKRGLIYILFSVVYVSILVSLTSAKSLYKETLVVGTHQDI
ncbi:hypothetical protein BDF21DRAFT_412756 [Thamnidium elegans]|nr:hypothetical protein BDF21DRAFT_412756 [Thamnidium elegans]